MLLASGKDVGTLVIGEGGEGVPSGRGEGDGTAVPGPGDDAPGVGVPTVGGRLGLSCTGAADGVAGFAGAAGPPSDGPEGGAGGAVATASGGVSPVPTLVPSSSQAVRQTVTTSTADAMVLSRAVVLRSIDLGKGDPLLKFTWA